MGGGLLQLVAVGETTIPLIGNPQITFFKSVHHKRYANFSMESIPLVFNSNPNFGKKISCHIDRKGDILTDLLLEVKLPALSNGISWVNGIGHHLIQKVELEIAGEIVDTIHGQFLDTYHELVMDNAKLDGYYKMVGKYHVYNKYTQSTAKTLYINLPFWFCSGIRKKESLGLPLVALQHSKIVVHLHLETFANLWYSGTSMTNTPDDVDITSIMLYGEYIYLEPQERRRVAIEEHQYLIQQHQICSNNPVIQNNNSTKVPLEFNLPVTELIWIFQADRVSETNDWSNYSNTLDNDQAPVRPTEPITKVSLRFDGLERFATRDGSYFRLVEPFRYHSRVPDDFIYNYNFSLKPEGNEIQPSGHCDFSRITSATLDFDHPNDILQGKITVYAINYNTIRIKNGQLALRHQS